jgi:hypothetical protein
MGFTGKHSVSRVLCKLLAVCALVFSVGQVQAHHSFAVHFVADQLITVKGVVTSYKFTNPHGILNFSVTKEDGSVEAWRAETNSPNVLRRRGWNKDSLKPGDEITVVGFPARDGTPYMRISKITFADGHELTGQASTDPTAQD